MYKCGSNLTLVKFLDKIDVLKISLKLRGSSCLVKGDKVNILTLGLALS
jgi:hypothetical protein